MVKALGAEHRLLNAVLDFALEEDSILAGLHLGGINSQMGPALQHLILEVLKSVLASLVEHAQVALADGGP